MKWEWAFEKSYFPRSVCELIINQAAVIDPQPAKVGSGVDEKIRRSIVRFIPNERQWQWLFDCLWRLALQSNAHFGFDITQLGYIQLAEYRASESGEYKTHHDVFWVTDNPLHRKLSCVVQLSDPAAYAGGDLQLYEVPTLNAVEARQQGSVIFFPSFTRHAALPVTQGTRYSLAAWFEGPKWK